MTDRQDESGSDEAPQQPTTSEREALPLPLPGSADALEPAVPPEPPAAQDAPTAEEPAAAGAAAATPEPLPPPPPPPPEPPDQAEAASQPEAASPPESAPEPPPLPEDDREAPSPPPFAPADSVAGLADEAEGPRPEVLVAAAFAGGLVVALILRRLTR